MMDENMGLGPEIVNRVDTMLAHRPPEEAEFRITDTVKVELTVGQLNQLRGFFRRGMNDFIDNVLLPNLLMARIVGQTEEAAEAGTLRLAEACDVADALDGTWAEYVSATSAAVPDTVPSDWI